MGQMSKGERNTPWVVVDGDGKGQVGRCVRCGGRLTLGLPMGLTAVVLYMQAFVEEHRYCKEAKDGGGR
jgi:hypothetical protein